MNRIVKLREEAVLPPIAMEPAYLHFFEEYFQREDLPPALRYAEGLYAAFARIRPAITPGELILGKYTSPPTPEEKVRWQSLEPKARETVAPTLVGQDSHMAVDLAGLLSSGITGYLERIEGYLQSCPAEKRDFYLACQRSLQGVLLLSERYADEAERLAEQAEGQEREELFSLAEICRRVPKYPAETFHQAVQSVHFLSHCLTLAPFRLCSQQFQLGRPDRYLLPYYERDLAQGKITRASAQELLDCLGIQINNRVPSGLSSGYLVGGTDEEGRPVENDLTFLCMQVVEDLGLVYPAVGLCVAKEMTNAPLAHACRILAGGHSHPAIFNDEVIRRGLESYGVPRKDSGEYIHSTCVEITPIASSNVWVASPYHNMAALLLETLKEGAPDYETLYTRLLARLDEGIRREWERQCAYRQVRTATVNPLLSVFVKDCLESGLDIESGGARYNWIMPSFVGMANLADALYVLKQAVFTEGLLSQETLCEHLAHDFAGEEALRQRLLHHYPKYGNDEESVDAIFGGLVSHIAEECKRYSCPLSEGRLIPSVFCWVMHERFGRETGATPDGRKAGFPLGDGSGPCQGREKKGPTASILSSTKWNHAPFIGGVAVNMKFSKRLFREGSLDTLFSLIRVFLERGGFEMQINVLDGETLKKAQKAPEEYRDLVVRIGGYSDYFVRLSPQMQEEVILRTEHQI